MDRRLNLHEELCEVLGSRNVYYNPPESIKLKYPCIVYSWNDNRENHANDSIYFRMQGYTVTVISRDPDNEFSYKLEDAFTYARFERRFVNDDLYHDVLHIFY